MEIKFDALDEIENYDEKLLYTGIIKVLEQLCLYFKGHFDKFEFYIEESSCSGAPKQNDPLLLTINPEVDELKKIFNLALDFYMEIPERNGYRINLFSIYLDRFSENPSWTTLESKINKKNIDQLFRSPEEYAVDLNKFIKTFGIIGALRTF